MKTRLSALMARRFPPLLACLAMVLPIAGTIASGATIPIQFKANFPGFVSGLANDVKVSGNLAYVAMTGGGGLAVVDISDPQRLRRVGGFDASAPFYRILLSDSHAFIAAASSGVQILDVANPAVPRLIETIPPASGFSSRNLAIDGDLLLIAEIAGANGAVQAVNISSISSPRLTGRWPFQVGQTHDIDIRGSRAYVAVGIGGFQVLNIFSNGGNYTLGYSGGYMNQANFDARSVDTASGLACVTSSDGSKLVTFGITNSSPAFLDERTTLGQPNDVRILNNRAHVADGSAGMQIYDVATPGNPRRLGGIALSGSANGLDVIGSTAFVAAGVGGLQVVDLTDPARPVSHGAFPTSWSINDVAIQGNSLFLANESGLEVLDVSTPYEARRVGGAPLETTNTTAKSVAISGRYALVAAGTAGLRIHDISDPATPQLIGVHRTNRVAEAVQVNGALAIVRNSDRVFELISITNPANPRIVGVYSASGSGPMDRPIAFAQGSYLFTVVSGNTTNPGRGLQVIDISNPSAPLRVGGETAGVANADGIAAHGNRLYVARSTLEIYDITNPRAAIRLSPASGSNTVPGGGKLSVKDEKVYIFGSDIRVIDVSDPTRPSQVGSYPANGVSGLALAGNHLFAVRGAEGMSVLEMSTGQSVPPSIVSIPESQRLAPGAGLRLHVGAIGTLPLFYQWHRFGTNLPGATSAYLALTNVREDGAYSVDISNAGGTVTSPIASVTVDRAPIVEWRKPSTQQAFLAGDTIALEVEARDPDGTLVSVEFRVGDAALGAATLSPTGSYFYAWTNAAAGIHPISARATDNEGVSTVSSLVSVLVTSNSLFQVDGATYRVSESNGPAVITIRRNDRRGLASIGFATENSSARAAIDGGIGQYYAASGRLEFAPGEAERNVLVALVNDQVFRGDRSFHLYLTDPDPGWGLGYTNRTVITILEDEQSHATNSNPDVIFPQTPPSGRGTLTVTLNPPAGKWRFVWETSWRNHGATARNLVPGEYPVEFLPLAQAEPPSISTNVIAAGATEVRHYEYNLDETAGVGSLKLTLWPASAASRRWRLLGQESEDWHAAGDTIPEVPAGLHLVQFAEIDGYIAPPTRLVTVIAGLAAEYEATYRLRLQPASAIATPAPLSGLNRITNSPRVGFPYAFNGQILSEAGESSGFVVKRRTVLTAAHSLFDSTALGYTRDVWWFFQRHRDEFEPIPQQPRGWYVFEGYAAARSRELTNEVDAASSFPTTRQQDVAALYFANDAGRGGSGGYLTSDSSISWLENADALKLLTGYPVEPGSIAAANRGKMHEVENSSYHFTRIPIADQPSSLWVSPDLQSYPGNSGGPIYVQTTNSQGQPFFLPAGVYLGGSGESIVRAIDLDVVDLINRAEHSAISQGNGTGGGIINVSASFLGSSTLPAKLRIWFDPPHAVNAGAAWRISPTNHGGLTQETNTFRQGTLNLYATNTGFTIELRDARGYLTPTHQTFGLQHLVGGTTLHLTNRYVSAFQLVVNPGPAPELLLVCDARATNFQGTVSIQSTDDLQPAFWTPVAKVNVTHPGTYRISYPFDRLNQKGRFFRSVVTP